MPIAGFTVRLAREDEATSLSKIAYRSKASWGYSAEFMRACRRELTLTRLYLRRNLAFVLDRRGVLVGFYTIEKLGTNDVELGHLFVEPRFTGRGYGRVLIEHAIAEATRRGYRTMVIQGDPHAEAFYDAAGGKLVGWRESASVPGRRLPLFHVELEAAPGERISG